LPTALERAVDALSDPTVSTADALRRLLVVVRRVGATDLAAWLGHELGGYGSDDQLPSYCGEELPIALHLGGILGGSSTRVIAAAELPDHLAVAAEHSHLTAPVAELQALAEGRSDPERGLPAQWIGAYRAAVDAGQAPGLGRMILNSAGLLAPRTYLRGLLDQIKTAALELALEFEDVSPEVGETSGPTVRANQEFAAKVGGLHVQIMGGENFVIVGDNNVTAVGKGSSISLQPGDVDGLLVGAREFVDDEAVAALAEAVEKDGGAGGERTRNWLETVKAGGYGLAGGMASNGGYDGLQALVQAVFPQVFGR
jgi:hypothetical protein